MRTFFTFDTFISLTLDMILSSESTYLNLIFVLYGTKVFYNLWHESETNCQPININGQY
jgi:hypothetical protein